MKKNKSLMGSTSQDLESFYKTEEENGSEGWDSIWLHQTYHQIALKYDMASFKNHYKL